MLNYFLVSIQGKNPKRILTRIIKENINIEEIKYEKDRLIFKVSYEDYRKLKDIRTSYKIEIIKTVGARRIVQLYQKYKVSLTIFVISVFFIIFMSHFIVFINIESNNSTIKDIINKELIRYNIEPFTLKKKYNNLKNISANIKNDNLDKIEWIEFQQKGVFLIVRVIPRIQNEPDNDRKYKDIVASQNGYIRKIKSSKGQLLKNIDDYVKKGEVIVSGNIFRNDKVVGKVKANGKVYAEVWYLVKTNQSFSYLNASSTKGRIGISVFINDNELKLLYLPMKVSVNTNSVLFHNRNFSINLKREKMYIRKRQIYNYSELQKILELKAKKEILNNLNDDEYIISQKTLKKYSKNGKMYIEVFFKCYQDIAEEKTLQKIKEKKDGLND